jgi:hypothetical protein
LRIKTVYSTKVIYNDVLNGGSIPDGFTDFSYVGDQNTSKTIAHLLAERGRLPASFSDWLITNMMGTTVLDVAVRNGLFPDIDAKFYLASCTDFRMGDALHYALKAGFIPKNFDAWRQVGQSGKPAAHYAAELGLLPSDFNDWDICDDRGTPVQFVCATAGVHFNEFVRPLLRDDSGNTIYHILAKNNKLPEDFDEWELSNKSDVSVAHIYAMYNKVDKEFKYLHLKAKIGTVLEIAAMHGNLPDDFDWKKIQIEHGRSSVFHKMAQKGQILPSSFDAWDAYDDGGRTVAHYAAERGNLPCTFSNLGLRTLDEGRVTVAHVLARIDKLPDGFTDYMLRDGDGDTIYHTLAGINALPHGFDQWGLINYDNEPVAITLLKASYHLPPDFNQWELSDKHGTTVAHFAVTFLDGESIPDIEKLYAIRTKNGNSTPVAHFYVNEHKRVTDGFDAWTLADAFGETTAHVAVKNGITPPKECLSIADVRGHTVAHSMMEEGLHIRLPDSDPIWRLSDMTCTSVAHLAIKHKVRTKFKDMTLADNKGHTLAHELVRQSTRTPELSKDEWALKDMKGRTPAHLAAGMGLLDDKFNYFSLADSSGWTVAHEYVSNLNPNLKKVKDIDRDILKIVAWDAEDDKWYMRNESGSTVAHSAVRRGFQIFDSKVLLEKDYKGVTVFNLMYRQNKSCIHNIDWSYLGSGGLPLIEAFKDYDSDLYSKLSVDLSLSDCDEHMAHDSLLM